MNVMRILDLQEFKKDQYNSYKERRTSQFTRFLDKTVDFVTYYSINKVLTTFSTENHAVDSYIGTDSPVRYNRINNLPVYGFPVIDQTNDYNDDEGGFSNDGFEGSIVMLHDIVEPSEGDCFVLNIFSERQFFQVISVEQITMREKPHYVVNFKIGIPDYLSQLNKQVVEEYNAIFDNIGTQDRVIISSNEYDLKKQFERIYKEIVEYYIATFYNSKLTTFEISLPMPLRDGAHTNYTDKFLIQFMKKNRIILFDSVLKSSFLLDYNRLEDSDDYFEYRKTLYWAIDHKSMDKFVNTNYIEAEKITSPFTLIHGQTSDEYFTSKGYTVTEPENKFFFEFSFNDIATKYANKDGFSDGTAFSKVLALIINYFKGSMSMPGYFEDLLGYMNPVQEFIYLPIILYIIRDHITGLMTTKITI